MITPLKKQDSNNHDAEHEGEGAQKNQKISAIVALQQIRAEKESPEAKVFALVKRRGHDMHNHSPRTDQPGHQE